MADPYIGEIKLFPFNFVPQGWAACNGQLLAINQNQALFAILGTAYGGDGVTTFALPDLRGRVAVNYVGTFPIGTKQGEEVHFLTANETPAHTHLVNASTAEATVGDVGPGNTWATVANTYGTAASLTPLAPGAISTSGGSQPHPNMQPYLAVTFGIALVGVFPSRN